MAKLIVEGLVCGYGGAPVLHEVSLRVEKGQVVCLLGRNGAGKTTTLKAIMGLVRTIRGSIRMNGQELSRLPPHRIPKLGLGYVPQGRRLFPELTVEENLRLGLLVRNTTIGIPERIFELFPVLRDRLQQRAGMLSGGEQQMVAIARALCINPVFLLLDEPLEGLMPVLAERLLQTIGALAREGVGVLLAEQKIGAVLQVADAVLILEAGRVSYQGTRQEFLQSPELLIRNLGVRR
ncbi:MAG: ABC transporter ATP-binding protein [Armatimonadota bacterium]|nr:ABC transporter ATP-binding protein [Armatimonadota bacterium]